MTWTLLRFPALDGRPDRSCSRLRPGRKFLAGAVDKAVPDPAEAEKVMNEYWAYSNALNEAGASTGGDALQDSKTATTVRVKDGERVVTDGPFAETREVLGGYYLIDVPDLDGPLDWGARWPGAKYGSIEV